MPNDDDNNDDDDDDDITQSPRTGFIIKLQHKLSI
jgi:hypothetical protein